MTIIKAKWNKLLNRAENPQETLDYSYEQQLQLLQNVKRGVADVVTAKKRLELQAGKLETSVPKLESQARDALAHGREDLARMALERKTAAQAQLQDLDRQVSELESQQGKLEANEGARDEDRELPQPEGGHEGAVLGGRGLGADRGGVDRDRRPDGRRWSGDPARA